MAQKGPMYGALREPKMYIFSYIDPETGAGREVDDEEIRLCDARPVEGLLQLVERKEDIATLEWDEEIGQLIGKCRGQKVSKTYHNRIISLQR